MEVTNTVEDGEHTGQVPGAWVKELFAPIYDFEDIVAAGRDGIKTEERKIKRVPILDPESVREVFERVHQRVVEAEKQKQQEEQTVKEEEEEKKVDPRKSAIWNTEELDTLRKVYKSAKGEIVKLDVALREKDNYIKKLEGTVLTQRRQIEEAQVKLSEASKCNQRLVIHRDSLQQQLAVLEVKLAALTDMWHEIEAEKTKAFETLKAANIERDKERVQRQKLEADLAEAKQNLIRETALIESNIQTKFEIEINDLNEVIRDLTVELTDERKLHEASKRGLGHLRQHFACLPLNQIVTPNAVSMDQVNCIDHCSL